MTVRYETNRPDAGKVRERMRAIAQERRRFGHPASSRDAEARRPRR
jgi:putative transposase